MRLPKETILVHEIMSRPVVSADTSDSILGIAKKMKRNRVGAVVIFDYADPVGIITERDLVRRVIANSIPKASTRAKDIMSKPLITISGAETLEHAAEFMVKKRIKKLGVVDEVGRLVGVVSESDIIRNANYLIDVLKELIATGYMED